MHPGAAAYAKAAVSSAYKEGTVLTPTTTVSTTILKYAYDPLDRLTSGIYSGTLGVYTFGYGCDGVGNRTTQTRTVTSTQVIAYSYDNANRLTNVGGQAYSYDPNGNMLTRVKPSTVVSYNQTWYVDNLVEAVVKQDALTDYFVYDGDGKRVRKSEYTNLTTTVSDTFDSLNNTLWTYTPTYQMTVTDGAQNVLKSVGTGVDYAGNFYRNTSSLTNGQSASVDFKVDYTDPIAFFALESTSGPTMRWGVQATAGKLAVQYNAGAGFVYPKDLINPLKVNTWYRLTLRVDDLNGFRIELRERDGGTASATYTYPMPAGKTWRFHHWINNSTAYLDNYVERTDSVLSTVFIGNYFEQDLGVSNGVRTYYYLGGKRVAIGNATGLYFISGDQLGSTSLVTSLTGTVTTQMLFKPYGLVRWWSGTLETDYRFTGERQDSNAALYQMGARFYDNSLNRWLSPDTIVPDLLNPQTLNRFSYALNNPLKFVDPSGHDPCLSADGGGGDSLCGGVPDQTVYDIFWNPRDDQVDLAHALLDYYSAHPDYDPSKNKDLEFDQQSYAISTYATWKLDRQVRAGQTPDLAPYVAGMTAMVFANLPSGRPVQAGDAGKYRELKGPTGDNLTAHHMPQAALGFTGRDEGGALVITTEEHMQTRTFRARGALTVNEDSGKSFRDVLATDIRDLRSIDGVGSKYNEGIRNLIDYYETNFPDLIRKY